MNFKDIGRRLGKNIMRDVIDLGIFFKNLVLIILMIFCNYFKDDVFKMLRCFFEVWI